MSWLLPLWSTYVECCCNCPLFCCCVMVDVVFGICWVTQFDNWIGVPDTGDWFEEPPNNEEEEEIAELFATFRAISENKTTFYWIWTVPSFILWFYSYAESWLSIFILKRTGIWPFSRSNLCKQSNQTCLMARRQYCAFKNSSGDVFLISLQLDV